MIVLKKHQFWLAATAVLALLAAANYWLFSGGDSEAPAAAKSQLPRYSAGGLEIGVGTEPTAPQVGDNTLILELRQPGGEPVTGVAIEAFAEMPAMGQCRPCARRWSYKKPPPANTAASSTSPCAANGR
ncbi:hypothetical protein [Microbulbifer sp. HZ11]|uniref:hypothetical protein n=1 Tax=Microbulbifer sp. HZ11 TaxID=1453501 RepID=UPI0005BB94D9|nr:hypothetical protein [Microbulbifer sp. HZ11]